MSGNGDDVCGKKTKTKGSGKRRWNANINQVGSPIDPEVNTNPAGNDNDSEGFVDAKLPSRTATQRTSDSEHASKPAEHSRAEGSRAPSAGGELAASDAALSVLAAGGQRAAGGSSSEKGKRSHPTCGRRDPAK